MKNTMKFLAIAFIAIFTSNDLMANIGQIINEHSGKIYDVRRFPDISQPTGFRVIDPDETVDATQHINDFFSYVLGEIKAVSVNNRTYTLVFPNRNYLISSVLKFNMADLNIGSGNNKINIVGYRELPTQYVNKSSVASTNSQYIAFNRNLVSQTRMTTNNNPATTDFLDFQLTCMPKIIAKMPPTAYTDLVRAGKYGMLYLNNNKVIYSNSSLPIYTTVNLVGIHFQGYNTVKVTNSNILTHAFYNKPLSYSTAVIAKNWKNVYIDNIVIDDVYGNGILVENNSDIAHKNAKVRIYKNVIRNTWGYNPKKDFYLCSPSGTAICQAHDNYGDGIRFNALNKPVAKWNYIYNDLNVTGVWGRAGIVLAERQGIKAANLSYNFVSGYNKDIHAEGGYGDHKFEYNRLVGCPTAILVAEEDQPANTATLTVNNNYFSNINLPTSNKTNFPNIYPGIGMFSFYTTFSSTNGIINELKFNSNMVVLDEPTFRSFSPGSQVFSFMYTNKAAPINNIAGNAFIRTLDLGNSISTATFRWRRSSAHTTYFEDNFMKNLSGYYSGTPFGGQATVPPFSTNPNLVDNLMAGNISNYANSIWDNSSLNNTGKSLLGTWQAGETSHPTKMPCNSANPKPGRSPEVIQETVHNVFKLYPNPINSEMNILVPESTSINVNVDVTNIYGQSVYHNSFKNPRSLIKIDMSSQSNGIYFVRLTSGLEVLFYQKVVK